MRRLRYAVSIFAIALALVACDKKKAEKSEAETPAAEKQAPAEEKGAAKEEAKGEKAEEKSAAKKLPEEVLKPTKQALESYDRAHDLLVDDKTEGLAEAGKNIQKSAQAAAEKAGENLKPHLAALAEAGAMLEKSAGDIEAARKAYGEVSRSVIPVLAEAPALAANWHVFECGMAKGYKKWAQPEDKLANPYMGQKMPACGAKAELKP